MTDEKIRQAHAHLLQIDRNEKTIRELEAQIDGLTERRNRLKLENAEARDAINDLNFGAGVS